MAGIFGPVGKDAPNLRSDVRTVQQLLNRFRGSGQALLTVDGVARLHTIEAIKDFQREHVGSAHPDGIVSPTGRTIRALLGTSPHQARLKSRARPTAARTATASPAVEALGGPLVVPDKIAWGKVPPPEFKHKVIAICRRLGIAPDFLMACMALEAGEQFDQAQQNETSKATGLIQFMPGTAKRLGTTTQELKAMTQLDQLDYVEKFLEPLKGRLHTLEDVYLAILYPRDIGMDSDAVMFEKGSSEYEQNKAFDKTLSGKITVRDVSALIRAKLEKGLSPERFG